MTIFQFFMAFRKSKKGIEHHATQSKDNRTAMVAVEVGKRYQLLCKVRA